MRALITGAAGFVGKHLRTHLESCGDQVVSCDTHDFDIRDFPAAKTFFAECRPDVIYHLAGLAFVPECEDNFSSALEINVNGTENILRAARETCPEARVVLVSSGDLYGKVELDKLPCVETDIPNPINNYSLSKLFAESLAIRAEKIYGQRVVIIRPFNHIGPGQSPKFAVSSFAQQLAQIKKGTLEAKMKVGNLSARRDLTDVRDIVRGYRLAAEKSSGLYNLCTSQSVSIQSILEMLIKISGIEVTIEIDPNRLRPSETLETRGSFEKAKKELGWEPLISLEQSLKDSFDYFLAME